MDFIINTVFSLLSFNPIISIIDMFIFLKTILKIAINKVTAYPKSLAIQKEPS